MSKRSKAASPTPGKTAASKAVEVKKVAAPAVAANKAVAGREAPKAPATKPLAVRKAGVKKVAATKVAKKEVMKKPAVKNVAKKMPAAKKGKKPVSKAVELESPVVEAAQEIGAPEADTIFLTKKLKRSIKALGEAAQEHLIPLMKKHGAEAIAIGAAQVAARTKNSKLRAALLLIAPVIHAIKPKDAR